MGPKEPEPEIEVVDITETSSINMTAKPGSLEMVQKLVPVVGSKISFQVVDLNENFRPELIDICGNVLEVDTENDVIKVSVVKSKDVDLDCDKLSKRASILQESINGANENETEDENENEEAENEKEEIKEYIISQLSQIKVLEAETES